MSAVAMKQAAAGARGAGGGGGGAGGKHDILEGEFLGLSHSPPQFTPSSYEMTHHKRVRSGSISGRLRSASELEEKGLIDRVQKGALKDLILSGDEQLLSALDKFAVEGDAQELKALLRSGLLEGQHGDLDLDLLVDDLDLNFLQLSHSLGADALGDGHHDRGGGGDAYVQFAMDDVASFLVGDAPLPAATHTAVATAAAVAAASSSGAAHAGGPAPAGSAAASSGSKAAAGGAKKQTPQPQQSQKQKRPPPSSQPQQQSGAGAGAGDEQDLLSAMGDRVAGTLGRNRSMSLTHASTLVSFGVSPFEHGDDVGALAGMFIKEEHPPTAAAMAEAGGGQEGKGPAAADAGEDNSLAASLMPKAATPGGNCVSGVTVKTQPPSNHKTGGGAAGARPATPSSTTKPVVLPSIPVAIGKDGQPLTEREEGKQYVGAYSPESRRQRLERFWEKKKRRIWDRKVKYDVRKNFADSRIRVKGRFVKKEDEAILLEVSTLTGGAGAGPGGAQQSPEAAAAGELAALMGDEDALAALEGLGTMGGGGSSASHSDSNLLHHHHLAPSPPSPPGSPVIPALDP